MRGTVVYDAVKSGVSVISAHTNLDIADRGVNYSLLKRIGAVSYTVSEKEPFLRYADIEPVSSEELIKMISSSLDTSVQYNNVNKVIRKLAVCSGAGASFLFDALEEGADAFLTGEAKYNSFIDADENGILLITAGHFETENTIVPVLADMLKKEFPDIEIIESNQANPVNYYSN